MIEIKNLNKSLQDNLVLDDLNLNIEESSIYGLVGVNGSGKSTLLRCIAGIYKADSGSILFDNQEVYENTNIKKQILYIGDEPYYPLNSTIYSLANFYSTMYELDFDLLEENIKLFNLNPRKNINNFSKGMKRQVFLIIALSIKIKLLILDEAFDGLDPFVRLKVKKILSNLIDESNCVIISSHNLRELEDICDKFCLLEDHKIQTSGDIFEKKNSIHKIQVAFNEDIDLNSFKDLNIIKSSKSGRVFMLVVEGDIDLISEKIKALNPILFEVLNINFEELFLYEIERNVYYE